MIAYLCDKKKECAGSPSCGSLCNHTLDVSHAVNGPCKDPRGNDRFKVVELGDDPKYMELDDVYNTGKPYSYDHIASLHGMALQEFDRVILKSHG